MLEVVTGQSQGSFKLPTAVTKPPVCLKRCTTFLLLSALALISYNYKRNGDTVSIPNQSVVVEVKLSIPVMCATQCFSSLCWQRCVEECLLLCSLTGNLYLYCFYWVSLVKNVIGSPIWFAHICWVSSNQPQGVNRSSATSFPPRFCWNILVLWPHSS